MQQQGQMPRRIERTLTCFDSDKTTRALKLTRSHAKQGSHEQAERPLHRLLSGARE